MAILIYVTLVERHTGPAVSGMRRKVMSVITSTKATERLSRKLQRAGIDCWIAQSSGDSWGKYLVFRVGGKCIGGAGWSLRDAESKVDHMIAYKDCEDCPPWEAGM